jgi:hypothetical protein
MVAGWIEVMIEAIVGELDVERMEAVDSESSASEQGRNVLEELDDRMKSIEFVRMKRLKNYVDVKEARELSREQRQSL